MSARICGLGVEDTRRRLEVQCIGAANRKQTISTEPVGGKLPASGDAVSGSTSRTDRLTYVPGPQRDSSRLMKYTVLELHASGSVHIFLS